jgi:CRP/FNR family transcriptional regulator
MPDSTVFSELTAAVRERFPALAAAAPATLERIVTRGIHRKVPAGTVMFDAHTPCGGFPLVLSGSIKVLQQYPNGREMQLYRVKPGESCLLSGSCLLGHSDYTASGVAETEVELLIVPPADFHALIETDVAFRNHVFSLFGERLSTLLSLVEAIAYQKLDQRLAALLLARQDPVHATHQALADELGSVREIVSRLLRSFEDKGWVNLAREQIRIVDRGALEALASA